MVGRSGSSSFEKLKSTGNNGIVILGSDIAFSSEKKDGVEFSDIFVISISSQQLRPFMEELTSYSLEKKTFVLCMKGIEMGTGKRLTQVVEDFIPSSAHTAVWVGPGHAQDFISGKHNCMVIDSDSDEVKKELIGEFSGELIRFYFGTDLLGSEIGAASKNVIGIAAGLLDGCNESALKGALMSRGTREIYRLIEAMGGSGISAYGLAHLGDYEATLFSPHSHNRAYGEAFARGEKYLQLAEGVPTVEAMMILKDKYNVDLPICDTVYSVVTGKENVEVALGKLFERSLKHEF